MASRRDLKKCVNYIADMTVGLCMIEKMNAEGERSEAISDLIMETIEFRSDIVSRISHTEPGNVKGFYKKLTSDFNTKIVEILNKLNEI